MPSSSNFLTTLWSWVSELSAEQKANREDALSVIIRVYRVPLAQYAVTECHISESDAEDVVHDFFLKKQINREFADLAKADPNIGKFRTFLKNSFKQFALDFLKRPNAEKRGSGKPPLSLEKLAEDGEMDAEMFYSSKTGAVSFDAGVALKAYADAIYTLARRSGWNTPPKKPFLKSFVINGWLTIPPKSEQIEICSKETNLSTTEIRANIKLTKALIEEKILEDLRSIYGDIKEGLSDEFKEMIDALQQKFAA